MPGPTIKIAKLAIRNTYIRGIGIPVNDPGDLITGNHLLSQLIARINQGSSSGVNKQLKALFSRQKLLI